MAYNLNPLVLINSMKSVDRWGDTINANIAGSARTGYKKSDLYFGGGNATSVIKPATPLTNTIQIAENAISVDHVALNFKQGDIVNSTELTHLAIQGLGFFVLSAKAAGAVPANDYVYTRNGEFHVDALGRIVNEDGLFLLDNTTGNAAVANTNFNALANPNNAMIALCADNATLQYSRNYGGTVFEAANPAVMTYTTSNTNGSGLVLTSRLEASNVRIDREIAELSMSKNLYDALTKQFLVYLNNVDVGLNLIR